MENQKTPLTNAEIVADMIPNDPPSYYNALQRERYAKEAPELRAIMLAELEIVDHMITAAADAGYALAVFPAGEECEYDAPGSYDVKSAIFDLHAATIAVSSASDYLGAIYLVRGNGEDLVSDYSLTLESFVERFMREAGE